MADILVGSTTSACVEALVYNVNIIIVANNSGITSNPIPSKYLHHCKIAYSSEDIRMHIESFTNKESYPSKIRSNVLKDCFSKVDQNSVRKFITSVLTDK